MSLTPLVLTDTKIYFSSADLTGFSNKVSLPVTVEALEDTTFASAGWKERVGGLFDMTGSVEGFWQAGDATMPDDVFWASLGSNAVPATFVPTGGAVGDLAYFTKVIEARYDPSGSVGQLVAWAVDLQGNAPVVRGVVAHPNGTARTTSGSGTGQQVGAVTASQRMYANLHVLSVAGTATPTLTVKVQSSVDNTFTTPTDQITFTAATAVGGQVGSVLGAVTDQWWRVVWTITGTTPSFQFAVALGVAAK